MSRGKENLLDAEPVASPLHTTMSREPRRISPSPRIRELARQIELSGRPETSEGLPLRAIRRPQTVRMSLGDLDWTPRRAMVGDSPAKVPSSVIALPTQAIPTGSRRPTPQPTADTPPPIYEESKISRDPIIAHARGRKVNREGLPTSSDAMTLHIDLSFDRKDDVKEDASGLPDKPVSTMHDSSEPDVTASCSERHSMQGIADLASFQAYPSHRVFAHNAFRLHLPHLDRHMMKSDLFPDPCFTDARKVCSMEEARLYQSIEEKDDMHKLEICGAQLRVSKMEAKEGHKARHYKRGRSGIQGNFASNEEDKESRPLSKEIRNDALEWSKSHAQPFRSNSDTLPQKIPPLMLLESNTLDELKSNAIGPRKAPGGLLSYFPGLASFLGIVIDFVIGMEGSSMAAGMFRLQLFIDFVQLIRLNSPAAKVLSDNTASIGKVNSFVLVIMPSFLALDFVSVFGYAILVFLAWILLAAILLCYFWRMINKYNPNRSIEGYRSQPWLLRPFSRDGKEGKRTQAPLSQSSVKLYRSTAWSKFINILIVTLLTILYIPLGKLSIDALVWNSDYWPQGSVTLYNENPELYRDPSKVCYTTTMRRDEFNWAYVIVLMAASTTLLYTLWFPFAMRRAIIPLLPRISRYNELGQLRSSDELDAEYIRLLGRDSSPLCFLYNAYKRKLGNYKPLYLLIFKFSNIVIISLLTQDNCLWRRYQPQMMLVTRESVLVVFQTVLLIAHILILPFVDPIGNRSEMVGRASYVISSVFGLLVALQVSNYFVFNTWLLYIVYAVTYTANFYFAFASTVIVSHWIKRFQKRIDFSVDIFSPHLQLDKHIKRRVWQETLSIILLTADEYNMPQDQLVTFQVLDESCPPVLQSFQGSPAERHVENLKIVKQIGLDAYVASCEELRGRNAQRWKQVMSSIELEHCGPDAYWRPLTRVMFSNVTSYFGKAIWIPFPPMIVLDYDQVAEDEGHLVKLTTLEDLETFVHQNSLETIQRRKWVRSVLRAMDGQRVQCPHTAIMTHKSNLFTGNLGFSKRNGQYSLATTIYYPSGVLNVRKKLAGGLRGDNLQAGFEVSIAYEYAQSRDAAGSSVVRKELIVNGANAFGLSDDFDYSTAVQRFFHANSTIIEMRLPLVHSVIKQYRHSLHSEVLAKHKVMDYSFHADIFEKPILSQADLVHSFERAGGKEVLRELPQRYPATVTLLLERLNILAQSDLHKWWYLFWDDLWRKNSGDYKAIREHQEIFCPQFTSSLAWTPLSRAKLEEILRKSKGLWSEGKKKSAIFTPGLLNQIYFTMEEIVFSSRHRDPIQLGVADNHGLLHKTTTSQLSSFPHSSLTGGGTDHDEVSVLNRRQWAWTEQRLGSSSNAGLWQRLKRFLALSPYTPNQSMEEVWIYAKLIESRDGNLQYEAERDWDHKATQS